MNLAAVDTKQFETIIRNETPRLLEHTGRACCASARHWLVAFNRAMDFAITNKSTHSGPGWLKQRYAWGPSPWPLHWCEAVRRPVIDCGVFRELALEIFKSKGLEAYPAQVLRYQQAASTAHWQKKWSTMPDAFPWASEDFVYHEVVAVMSDDGACEIYDPTEGIWIDPDQNLGHNGHFAVRVESTRQLQWRHVSTGGFRWTRL